MEHDALARIETKLEQLIKLIKGNGEPGLEIRIDRLEQTEKRRRWQMRAIWSGVALAMVAGVGHLALMMIQSMGGLANG